MKDRFYEQFYKRWYLCMLVGLSVLVMLIFLVVFQVRFFTQQIQELVRLKEDYENYQQGFRRMIADTQSREHELGDVKKKMTIEESPFVSVNRDGIYLRTEAEQYVRSQGMFDAWKKQYMSEVQTGGDQQVTRRRDVRKTRHIVRRHQRMLSFDGDTDLLVHKHQFAVPIDTRLFWISSRFGPRKMRGRGWGFHYGVDLAAPYGTPVRAAGRGVIIEAGVNSGFGKTVVVSHSQECKTRYAHLSAIDVEIGDAVEQGQRIGRVGNTGNTRGRNGVHLHLEVLLYGKQVDPEQWFKQLRRA